MNKNKPLASTWRDPTIKFIDEPVYGMKKKRGFRMISAILVLCVLLVAIHAAIVYTVVATPQTDESFFDDVAAYTSFIEGQAKPEGHGR